MTEHLHGQPGDAGGRASARHLPRLRIAFFLTAVFLIVEAVTALLTGSLALLSDAGHMLTDVFGLGLAWSAIHLAGRATRPERTFGLFRLEILAALANAVLLMAVAGYVLYEAVGRLGNPTEVPAVPLMAVATVGLAVNVVSFSILRAGAKESLNVRGAFLEVMADMITSVAVLIGGIVILSTGWAWVDPVIGAAAGLFVVPRAVRLAIQSLRVLLQHAPASVDVTTARRELALLPGVEEVRDFHVWTLTSDMDVASAHLLLADSADYHRVLDSSERLLRDTYGVPHVTVQVEPAAHRECDRIPW